MSVFFTTKAKQITFVYSIWLANRMLFCTFGLRSCLWCGRDEHLLSTRLLLKFTFCLKNFRFELLFTISAIHLRLCGEHLQSLLKRFPITIISIEFKDQQVLRSIFKILDILKTCKVDKAKSVHCLIVISFRLLRSKIWTDIKWVQLNF